MNIRDIIDEEQYADADGPNDERSIFKHAEVNQFLLLPDTACVPSWRLDHLGWTINDGTDDHQYSHRTEVSKSLSQPEQLEELFSYCGECEATHSSATACDAHCEGVVAIKVLRKDK